MSQDILFEVNFFLHSFLSGVVITFVYDWFLILRRSVRHNIAVISLEDIVFWIACALGVFYMLFEENNGILRWFAVLGAALGMWIYKRLVSAVFVEVVSNCILKIVHWIMKPIAFAGKKVMKAVRFVWKKIYGLVKYLKKKLTLQLKLIRIALRKHRADKEGSNGKKSRISQKAPE